MYRPKGALRAHGVDEDCHDTHFLDEDDIEISHQSPMSLDQKYIHGNYSGSNIIIRESEDFNTDINSPSLDGFGRYQGHDKRNVNGSESATIERNRTQSVSHISDSQQTSGYSPAHSEQLDLTRHNGPVIHEQQDSRNGFRLTIDSSEDLNISNSVTKPSPTSKKRKYADLIGISEFRPRSAIPQRLSWEEFARQGILAAYCSRLNPYALHPDEYQLLRSHITKPQVTSYLNIRNAILRLWHRNPLVAVTRTEAAGCARDTRHLALSQFAFEWLLRNGYINFGCLDVPSPIKSNLQLRHSKRKTIVIVGAGMSGLGCARQLDGLFMQLEDKFFDLGEYPPKIIVLEGRHRIGGRVFSHPLTELNDLKLPVGMRSTAEMGAQIVTGWDHGNPLSILVRGQLALPYHTLREDSPLYDYDGTLMDKSKDLKVEKLWNYILERAAVFRNALPTVQTVEGDKDLINFFEEPKEAIGEQLSVIADLETRGESVTITDGNPISINASMPQNSAVGIEKVAGRQYQHAKAMANLSAAEAASQIGWHLHPGVTPSKDINLLPVSQKSEYPTLGEALDEGIKQYQDIIELNDQDMRLLNWHHANLEYANAANVGNLSLGGWDQDVGNEFEGPHSEIVGGYSQVPRGLWKLPTPLDVRFNHTVKYIHYPDSANGKASASVQCENGEQFQADKVVLTLPLGVLKSKTVKFDPPLPQWKTECVDRMGFGLLNKVVLVYRKQFWEENRDMFGLLNRAELDSMDQHDYSKDRGRFYFFWNVSKTAGQPVLIALMAGDAAYSVELSDNESLVQEATRRLSRMFAPQHVPRPAEVVITRWGKDPFARGTYSYVAKTTRAGDYDIMARPYGPIHFAGEATCGTHPATVHGAYLSGLRAAAEVVESIIGPIKIVESPLVPPKTRVESTPPKSITKRPSYVHVWEPIDKPDIFTPVILEPKRNNETEVHEAIIAAIGEKPTAPQKAKLNPYILYVSDHWDRCKAEMESKLGDGEKISRHDIRAALGVEWRNAHEDIKQPYLDRCKSGRDVASEALNQYNEAMRTWEAKARKIKQDFYRANSNGVSKDWNK